ncbi:glycosyltransferase [Agromyces larvae]|uniref:4,4'-diaponeurosporenoate glycosyltransferase n=1 Tax=Agromyces larvae TaxID=2929802 RepID=A0ABY4BYS3_9MICO|nr:glycosyltransferase [Agromyces larvae]UOE44332.1 glycosyltransferase [Agromyces larvae]
MTARMSVVVPAHDEAAIIGRLLRRIVEGDPDGRIELVVVANGCTDDTARVAASVHPRVQVVELDEGSKIAALNAGDRAAVAFPRAYVDADVLISATTLLDLADALDRPDGPLVAAPGLHVDTSGASAAVRAYYRVWALSEYRGDGHIGSGVYAVSAAGRARWAEFPDVIADDRFVQQQFLREERLTLAHASFTVRAPRTFRAQLARATRIRTGNRELPASLQVAATAPASARYGALVRKVARRPRLWGSFAVYCVGYGVPIVRSRVDALLGRTTGWNRDETVRAEAART